MRQASGLCSPEEELPASPLLLHHENERADQRRGEDEADALQRPDVIGHERFADLPNGQRRHRLSRDAKRRRLHNGPEQAGKDRERDDDAPPVKTAILFRVAPGEQNRENDQTATAPT